MLELVSAFITSALITLVIIRYNHLHEYLSADNDLEGPQKIHLQIVPRIGGISIIMGLFIGAALTFRNGFKLNMAVILIVCGLPTFIIGLLEDLVKNISVRKRLFITAISASMAVSLLDIHINKLDLPGIDLLFTIPVFSIVFTIFAITGLANAYNIIDGLNGLASMTGIISLLAISYISFLVGDPFLSNIAIFSVGAILGFFIWNYPLGLIFLGDGGAYLIGFFVATLSVLLTYKHPEVSPWCILLISGYPILETLFTIYRRKLHQGKSPGQPDGIHFHTILFRRILVNRGLKEHWFSANARTSPYLWIFSLMGTIPALFWWNSTPPLIVSAIIYTFLYIWLYTSIVRFKTPKWLYPSRRS